MLSYELEYLCFSHMGSLGKPQTKLNQWPQVGMKLRQEEADKVLLHIQTNHLNIY